MMITVRSSGVVGIVASALLLAACTSTPAVGVVTGLARPCEGVGTDHPPRLTVFLYSGRTVIASDTIRAGAIYRFSVTPGSYRVEGPGEAPKVVVIHAGHAVTDNIPDLCR